MFFNIADDIFIFKKWDFSVWSLGQFEFNHSLFDVN